MKSASKPRVKNPDTMQRCISVLMKHQGMSRRAATKRVAAISRQRMWAILWKAQQKRGGRNAVRRKLSRVG